MKRSCKDCKALDENTSGICRLGYAVTVHLDPSGRGHRSYSPKEECPKPRTLKKYCQLLFRSDRDE
ncbi:MAG: hypothetical protein ACRCYP_01605 [Alphaproteobacteria bacterium]